MPIEQSEAIVIKTVEFSESSLILDLFTRNFGKISGIAKGARRLKNSFESGLDLLAQNSLSFIRKNSDALDLMTEAKLIHRFRPNRENLAGLYAGYSLAELLRLLTEEGEAQPELYDLAVESLDRFEAGRHIAEYLHRFEWGLLEYSGQRPSTRQCVSCDREIFPEEERRAERGISFGFLDGGVICADCRQKRGFQQVATLDPLTVEWLDRLDPLEEPSFFETESTRVRKEIQGVIGYCIGSVCGKKPRLQEITEKIIAWDEKRKG